MKKTLIAIIFVVSMMLMGGKSSYAQMMGNFNSSVTPDEVAQTKKDENEGKAVWDKLQNKQISCKDLSDDEFDVLGDFFMGNAVGSNHASMNLMMKQRMGDEGEKQMHIAMGKRLSGCETNAAFPRGYGYFMPMMWGMMGGGGNPMMSGWGGFGLGWIFMIIFWALIILGVVALVRYLGGQHNTDKGVTPLEILKERYAKGEVSKKEFEEMKKNLK